MQTSGLKRFRKENWKGLSVQFSWPEIIFTNGEHYIGLPTCVRVYIDRKRREYAAGFRFLGFGIAVHVFVTDVKLPRKWGF